jgi:hypothetical protein
MYFYDGRSKKLDLILAADSLRGKTDPCNDHIWRLTSGEGEPVALELTTTYGLRAYGMRLFPRFHLKNETVTNPDSFSEIPSIKFQTPDFIDLGFKPFPSLDVTLKIWVPSSQVLVGQVTITLNSNQPESLLMEWVAILEPFSGGRQMGAKEHGINTILTGKSRDIEPVFLLAGMPRTDSSAYPSLGLEIALRPSQPRKLTWVLASLENEDLSFFTARRYTASSLDAEQIKLEMVRYHKGLAFGMKGSSTEEIFLSNRNRMEQLILPPFGRFKHPSIVQSRNEDNGYSQSHDGGDSGPSWGIQTSLDAYIASKNLLPAQPEILKGIVQNFLDQQSDAGVLDMNTSWTGKRSGMNATPLLAGLALEVYNYTQDAEWMERCFPQLLLGFNTWFTGEKTDESHGFPAWQHILQTGLVQDTPRLRNEIDTQEILIQTANSPALAALLYRECKCLQIMAAQKSDFEAVTWLRQINDQLFENIQSCWNERESYFQYQDKINHSHLRSKKVLVYKRNGTFPVKGLKSFSSFTGITCQFLEVISHRIEILIYSSTKIHSFTQKSMDFTGNTGIAVVRESLSNIKTITIRGLKKGESVSFKEPDLSTFDASCVVPFWADAASEQQVNDFIDHKLPVLEEMLSKENPFLSFYKIILLEFLLNHRKKLESLRLIDKIYGVFGEQLEIRNSTAQAVKQTLNDLIPLKLILSLYGIEKWTPNEIILENDDTLLPPITVQYGQTTIEFLQGRRKITHANGESTILDKPGKTRVLTA